MHDKVSRLRQLMAEAVPRPSTPSPAEADARREFDYFAANEPIQPVLDMSPRARAVREIMRIADWYQTHSALIEFMDRSCVSTLSGMSDGQLEDALEHMRQIESCTQTGIGSPYAPAAT